MWEHTFIIVTVFIITNFITFIIINDVLRYGSRIDAQSSDEMNGALAMESQQVKMVKKTMVITITKCCSTSPSSPQELNVSRLIF